MSEPKPALLAASENGGSNPSQKSSPVESVQNTGSYDPGTESAKQSTLARKSKPEASTQPSWMRTDPTILAAQQADLLKNKIEAGWFVKVTEQEIDGLPVINVLLAAPKGHSIGYKDGSITVDGEPV